MVSRCFSAQSFLRSIRSFSHSSRAGSRKGLGGLFNWEHGLARLAGGGFSVWITDDFDEHPDSVVRRSATGSSGRHRVVNLTNGVSPLDRAHIGSGACFFIFCGLFVKDDVGFGTLLSRLFQSLCIRRVTLPIADFVSCDGTDNESACRRVKHDRVGDHASHPANFFVFSLRSSRPCVPPLMRLVSARMAASLMP